MLGLLSLPTRGADGPGEVVLQIRGGSETYVARSAHPLPRGTEVVIVSVIGPRQVEVQPVEDDVSSVLDLSEGK